MTMGQGVPVEQARLRGGEGAFSRIDVHAQVEGVATFQRCDLVVDRSLPAWINITPTSFRVHETSKVQEFLIRFLDVTGASLILLLSAPVTLIVSLLIKILSPGPVLYRQERVGKQGRVFVLYKFRSMIDGAEKHLGPVWAAKDDDRVTPIGKVMRKIRIDEIPQLFNVLKGDMSLVGPRPERPFFIKRHQALQGVRLAVKPGLTGLAQIRAFYDLKPEHKLKYDYLYIQKRSFLLNLSILLKTVPVVIRKTGW
jgi:lipopolysaccharide/colanic/teichoic acid biosynthesis glycosyltransferase